MSQNKEENNELSSPTGGQGFIPIQYFTNYIDANIVLGRLEEDGIICWLKDENTVTIDPILSNAIGGIKLMVAESQVERAREILQGIQELQGELNRCPKCGSNNVQLISSPRKAINWLSSIVTFLMGSYAVAVDKTNHCFDCDHEFDPVIPPQELD